MNVRFEAGEHARVLNEITGKKYHFNESIGHLPEEAFVGSII
jgi:acid phosphatase family membrane protein YuiD